MKILTIPDIHLKPWMFDRAKEILKNKGAEMAVCLMDIADDWGLKNNAVLYREAYDAAVCFAKTFPNTVWCYGNHDMSYIWGRKHSGYSDAAAMTVNVKMQELQEAVIVKKNMVYVFWSGNIVFSHGGLSESFVRSLVQEEDYYDIETVVEYINHRGSEYNMWTYSSPILYRPQFYAGFPGGSWAETKTHTMKPYRPDAIIQVVGHTSVLVSGKRETMKNGNFISCDTFSTDPDRTIDGGNCFTIIDSAL